MPTREELHHLGFEENGSVILDNDGRIDFSINENIENPCVYLWALEIEKDNFEIKYVGVAGADLQARMNQHKYGFRGALPGRNHFRIKQEIIDIINSGRRILVFARRSDPMVIFGVNVTLCFAEELALIQRFNPPWNAA